MALRSMTGFGRSEQTLSDIRISVELKSVNSRFLDLNLRMPKKFNALEGRIRKRVKDYLSRGKLDLYLMYEDFSVERGKLCLNLSLAREYYAALSQIAEALSIRNEPQASRIAEFPDVLLLTEEEGDREKFWARLNPCLTEALESFLENREAEGINLGEDLLAKLREMEEIVQKIEKRSPEIVRLHERHLREKLSELLSDTEIDEGRLMQEMVLYTDKLCTDEELVRLHSHIDNMRRKLTEGGTVGRELDFLAQEMNREANTILSKANDMLVSEDAIHLKTLIEKIREQVQNLE